LLNAPTRDRVILSVDVLKRSVAVEIERGWLSAQQEEIASASVVARPEP
jgi:hypothetical protein